MINEIRSMSPQEFEDWIHRSKCDDCCKKSVCKYVEKVQKAEREMKDFLAKISETPLKPSAVIDCSAYDNGRRIK